MPIYENKLVNLILEISYEEIDFSTLKLACDGNWDKITTLKALYSKGWRYVGTALTLSGGQVVIVEK
jgi:hypothetical protein